MKKADEVLRSFIPTLNMREQSPFIDLFYSWTDILGEDMEDIAAHSEPVDIKNGALIVYVDHPGWMQRLDFKKKYVLQRLKKQYNHINNILIQKVSNEKFIERREARFMGNNPEISAKRRL